MQGPRKSFVVLFLVVLVLGAAAIALLYPRAMVKIVDADGNGVPEKVIHTTLYGDLVSLEEDMDQDGKVDRREFYQDNLPLVLYADQNLDGKMELTALYTPRGEWAMLLRDSDEDGRVDVISFFDNGKQPPLGIIQDRDGDGVFDYSYRGKETNRRTGPEAPPAAAEP